MKRIIAIIIILSLVPSLSAFAISKNEPLKNLSKGLNDIAYGSIEVPDNIDETNTKGKVAYPECTDTTKDGVGRGIARVVGGIWEIATFWYPED